MKDGSKKLKSKTRCKTYLAPGLNYINEIRISRLKLKRTSEKNETVMA
jgi:hypothetical protein